MSGQESAKGGASTPRSLPTPQPLNVETAPSPLSGVDIETYRKALSPPPPLLDKDQSNYDIDHKLTVAANTVKPSPLEQDDTKSLNKGLIDKCQTPSTSSQSSSSITTVELHKDLLKHTPSQQLPLVGSELFNSSQLPSDTPLTTDASTKTTDHSNTEQQQYQLSPRTTTPQKPAVPQVLQANSGAANSTSYTSNRTPVYHEPDDIISGFIEQKPHLPNLATTTNSEQPSEPQKNECDTNTCVKSTQQQFKFLLDDEDDDDDSDDDEIPLASAQNKFIPFEDDNDQLLTDDDPLNSGGPHRRHNLIHLGSAQQTNSLPRRLFNQIYCKLFVNSHTSDTRFNSSYNSSESEDLLSDRRRHRPLGRRRRTLGKTFRGSYKYSRSEVSMAIMRKLFHMLFQRSTLALFGAFLIHVTLGTVYTLSNVNSYMTSYMRLNGSPNATYGGAVWISSLCAVGQGFTMVLGGLLEKRFSARLACFLGCALHSLSIASTSWSINYGPLAVLVTYGLLPGFGIGLAYMTPMTNGFGWFPNKRGLVAGVILAGFGIGTFVFNMVQTAFVNPTNLSPPSDGNGYFTQKEIIDRVPNLFIFMGSIYAMMQFVGCCLIFKPPNYYESMKDERPILVEQNLSVKEAVGRKEFIVLFIVYGIITQGVLFVNAMIKEYGQLFIGNDMYLAWVGSMSSIANASGRLVWGIAIDRFSFSQCFTAITILFASLMFLMPFEFILSNKLLYLVCTLGLFGSFSGWMSIFPVHVSRVFGRTNSGVIYGLVFTSQSFGGIISAIGNHYLIDNFSRFVPFFCHVLLNIIGLTTFHLFYPR